MRRFSVALLLACAALACSRARAVEARTAPETAAVPVAAGPRAEGQGFVVEVVSPAEATIGAAGVVKVVLKPTGGYHVNKEFPTALTVTAPAGVDVPKAKQTPADAAKFTDDGAVFEVAFTTKDGGEKSFEASFKFAVCTSETCDPKSEKLAWKLVSK